jgi:O-antigen ligase
MKGGKIKMGYPAPLVALVIYTAWTVWDRSSAVPVPFHYAWLLLPVGVLLLGGYIVLLSDGRLSVLSTGRMVVLLAASEGIVCLLQYLKWIDPPGDLYQVCGTLANPNLTAMFIAMTIPLLFFIHQNDRSRFRFFIPVAFVFSGIALLLLQSRAAGIGAGIAGVHFFARKYHSERYIKVVFTSKWRLTGAIILLFAFLSVMIYGVYHFKKASSDSRLLIWKIGIEMLAEKPVSGYGYYSFEQRYNLAQAAYFESGRGTEAERYNAAHVRIGYNDFFQNMMEGGITGFLLYLIFIGSLLYAGRSRLTSHEQRAAYSGILVFSSMSLFNTAELTVPVFSMLMLYTSVLCVGDNNRTYYTGKWMAILLVLVALLMIFYQLKAATASLHLKKAQEYAWAGQNEKALDALQPYSKTLQYAENYWIVSGMASQKMKKYDLALDKYRKALNLTSSPEVYIRQGECLMETGQYNEAIQSCSTALNIAPSRLLPRYTLMKIHERQMDTVQVLRMAHELINQTPKGNSKNADFFKKEALKLIKSYKK